ncbi:hypothetical protein BaRGS_00012885, partial [Batillaria attramentaria]
TQKTSSPRGDVRKRKALVLNTFISTHVRSTAEGGRKKPSSTSSRHDFNTWSHQNLTNFENELIICYIDRSQRRRL